MNSSLIDCYEIDTEYKCQDVKQSNYSIYSCFCKQNHKKDDDLITNNFFRQNVEGGYYIPQELKQLDNVSYCYYRRNSKQQQLEERISLQNHLQTNINEETNQKSQKLFGKSGGNQYQQIYCNDPIRQEKFKQMQKQNEIQQQMVERNQQHILKNIKYEMKQQKLQSNQLNQSISCLKEKDNQLKMNDNYTKNMINTSQYQMNQKQQNSLNFQCQQIQAERSLFQIQNEYFLNGQDTQKINDDNHQYYNYKCFDDQKNDNFIQNICYPNNFNNQLNDKFNNCIEQNNTNNNIFINPLSKEQISINQMKDFSGEYQEQFNFQDVQRMNNGNNLLLEHQNNLFINNQQDDSYIQNTFNVNNGRQLNGKVDNFFEKNTNNNKFINPLNYKQVPMNQMKDYSCGYQQQVNCRDKTNLINQNNYNTQENIYQSNQCIQENQQDYSLSNNRQQNQINQVNSSEQTSNYQIDRTSLQNKSQISENNITYEKEQNKNVYQSEQSIFQSNQNQYENEYFVQSSLHNNQKQINQNSQYIEWQQNQTNQTNQFNEQTVQYQDNRNNSYQQQFNESYFIDQQQNDFRDNCQNNRKLSRDNQSKYSYSINGQIVSNQKTDQQFIQEEKDDGNDDDHPYTNQGQEQLYFDQFTPLNFNNQNTASSSENENCNIQEKSFTQLNSQYSSQFFEQEARNYTKFQMQDCGSNKIYDKQLTSELDQEIGYLDYSDMSLKKQESNSVLHLNQAEISYELANHQKKNVVKNIMTSFKNFVTILFQKETQSLKKNKKDHQFQKSNISIYFQEQEKNNLYDIRKEVLKIYLNNESQDQDDNEQSFLKKFKRYINHKHFNNQTLSLLLKHKQYSQIFNYFLENFAKNWVINSKIKNYQSHYDMIQLISQKIHSQQLVEKKQNKIILQEENKD